MKPLVECCNQNAQSLEMDPTVQQMTDFISYPCLNHCSLCAEQNYVLFEGDILVAETSEQLQKAIIDHAVAWQKKEELDR